MKVSKENKIKQSLLLLALTDRSIENPGALGNFKYIKLLDNYTTCYDLLKILRFFFLFSIYITFSLFFFLG